MSLPSGTERKWVVYVTPRGTKKVALKAIHKDWPKRQVTHMERHMKRFESEAAARELRDRRAEVDPKNCYTARLEELNVVPPDPPKEPRKKRKEAVPS